MMLMKFTESSNLLIMERINFLSYCQARLVHVCLYSVKTFKSLTQNLMSSAHLMTEEIHTIPLAQFCYRNVGLTTVCNRLISFAESERLQHGLSIQSMM